MEVPNGDKDLSVRIKWRPFPPSPDPTQTNPTQPVEGGTTRINVAPLLLPREERVPLLHTHTGARRGAEPVAAAGYAAVVLVVVRHSGGPNLVVPVPSQHLCGEWDSSTTASAYVYTTRGWKKHIQTTR